MNYWKMLRCYGNEYGIRTRIEQTGGSTNIMSASHTCWYFKAACHLTLFTVGLDNKMVKISVAISVLSTLHFYYNNNGTFLVIKSSTWS